MNKKLAQDEHKQAGDLLKPLTHVPPRSPSKNRTRPGSVPGAGPQPGRQAISRIAHVETAS